MSFLTPLYLAGLAALSLPILLHLIRRSPRGEQAFSSHMFLLASPPRLTRRSRLDNLLLLLLRAAVLALLACAFARPFLRQAALVTADNLGRQRVAILVDTSASMRRGDLWAQAIAAVDAALDRCRPQDEVAVYAFDDHLHPVASFEDLAPVELARRRATIDASLKSFSPTWASTHLGEALAEAVAVVSESRDQAEEIGRAPRRIVLISDVQEGSRAETLGEFAWPDDVRLELVALAPADPTNAGVERLADDTAAGEPTGEPVLRVRVVNSAESSTDRFRLAWHSGESKVAGEDVNVYVPAGESRVARVPLPQAALEHPRLVLAGDAADFDNTLYFLPWEPTHSEVVYLGDEKPDDPEGLYYYLARALESTPARKIKLTQRGADVALFDVNSAPQLVVLGAIPSSGQLTELKQYLAAGGTVLDVLREGATGETLAGLLGADSIELAEADVAGYTMLGEIAFDHPLFVPMAGPQFNDFTHIRFWKYRRLDPAALPEARVLARFEGGDPAILQQHVGQGRLLVMTAGWQPADGQLARSWKFLLMLSALIEENQTAHALQSEFLVHDRVRLPKDLTWRDQPQVTTPAGDVLLLESGAEAFTATDAPGVYTLATAPDPEQFVVELDPLESRTTPLAAEALEQLGCRLVSAENTVAETERLQQLRDVELEGRQKIWKWLVVAALVLLVIETVLAGWLSRPGRTQLAPSS